MDPQEVRCGDIDGIELTQDRDRWWAPAKEINYLEFYKTRGISSLAANPLSSQEGLRSMELLSKYITHFC
jgi:hypothetical protein